MSAYASLVSLARKLQQIHGDPNHILHLHLHLHLQDADFNPLLENVVELLAAMENIPQTTPEFEEKVADSANRADDIIDYYVSNLLMSQDNEGSDGEDPDPAIFTPKIHYDDDDDDDPECVILTPWMADEDPELSCKDLASLREKIEELTDESTSLLVEAKSLQFQGIVVGFANIQINESVLNTTVPRVVGKLSVAPLGFEAELRKLRERLYGDSSEREVIPIVGMGGSGKTTLATVLYEDNVNSTHFDRVAWITVSQSYDICRVLAQLLKDLKVSSSHSDSVNLGLELSQVLKKRRYLIVIDDIWSKDCWDQIKVSLPDDGNRSRILLTTRLEDVGSYAESCIHGVELMDVERSWSLLKEKVFGEKDCPIELEEIGKAIAEKCGGLPLAIVAVAGILSGVVPNQDSWEKIAEDVTTAIMRLDENHGVMEILSLSYRYLSHHLKSCFLYLGLFPEDHVIDVRKLKMRWVAEGFLKKPNDSVRSEEDVAYKYLEDLAEKNLILVSKRGFDGRMMDFGVHDLIRDLCVETAVKERFVYQMDDKQHNVLGGIKNPRRVSICSGVLYCGDAPCIRSALFFRRSDFKCGFRLIRVLDAPEIRLSKFPSQVCQLFHLRYLAFNLYGKKQVEVPSSINKLQNLQVLHLHSSDSVVLPLEIWKMPQLRHLIFPYGAILPDPPPFVGPSSLENLQTLSVYDFRFTQQVLQMIPNIRDLTMIYRNEIDMPPEYYALHNLVHLSQLESVDIRGYISLENIQLPQNLKALELDSWSIPWEVIGTIAGSLPNLEVLKVTGCDGDIWETREEEFPKLKMFEISSSDLVRWRSHDDEGIFPRLQRLVLSYCKKLREVPCCIAEIDTLVSIEIDNCSEYLVEWAKQLREEQDNNGYGDIQFLLFEP